MEPDDPFFSPPSDDHTIIRPIPGGRRADIPSPTEAIPTPTAVDTPLPQLGQLNPLEAAASGLLSLLTRLNHSHTHNNPDQLKDKLTREIRAFQQTAQAQGIDSETAYTARYILCTVLDEAALRTPWGHQSGWSQHSLLSSFHKEVSGGERFFDLLRSFAEYPEKNRNILELMYLCLALGFEGSYRIAEGGKDKLARIKEWLYDILQKQRGHVEHTLSPHWQGVTDRRNPLMRYIPFWVFGLVIAALLALMFSGALFYLNRQSDPVFKQIHGIKTPAPKPQAPPPVKITLSELLAEEIEHQQVNVNETSHQSRVTIQGDSLFRSGSATVNQTVIPLLYRIGAAVDQLPGQVIITGHSDSQPIRSARFPSNWHLSQQRAEAVANEVKDSMESPTRVVIEGKADLEPVASNKTREGRAKNRRVNIVLVYGYNHD